MKFTVLGIAKVSGEVQSLKSHIKLFPIPPMGTKIASIFDRLLPAVHAQTMSPYGEAFSQITYDDTTGILYGTGITNASSYCNCHSSSVYTTMGVPGGGGTMNSDPGGGQGYEYAEADAGYQWGQTASDFTDGDVQVTSTHNSYCPLANANFIYGETTATGPLRSIWAYYKCDQDGMGACKVDFLGVPTYRRCNPNNHCDTLLRVVPGRPLYGLFHVGEISWNGSYLCVGELDEAVNQCYSPDPKP